VVTYDPYPDPARLLGTRVITGWELAAGSETLLRLAPGGWLAGLVMEVSGDEAMYAVVSYQLTDANGVALYGEAETASPYSGLDQRIQAIILPEPVPNMNSAYPYILYVTTDRACTLTVTRIWRPVKQG
jgi:hypothetical protein